MVGSCRPRSDHNLHPGGPRLCAARVRRENYFSPQREGCRPWLLPTFLIRPAEKMAAPANQVRCPRRRQTLSLPHRPPDGRASHRPGQLRARTCVRNEDLAALGYDADWIVQRTGITERRHAAPGVSTGDLATEAARGASPPAASAPSRSTSCCWAPSRPTCSFRPRPTWSRTAWGSVPRPSTCRPPARASPLP